LGSGIACDGDQQKLMMFIDLEHSTIAGTSSTFTGVVTFKLGN